MEEQIKNNMKRIFYLDLSFESYTDNTKNEPELLVQTIKKLNNYRENKDKLSLEEKLSETEEILKNFDMLLDMVGRENFIFYEDGSVEYKWR